MEPPRSHRRRKCAGRAQRLPGPYIHRMYPIDPAWSAAMRADGVRGRLGMKLAFARISFNYFISETVFDYIVEAVHLIANEGGSCCRSTASM